MERRLVADEKAVIASPKDGKDPALRLPTESTRWPVLSPGAVALVTATWTLVLAVISVFAHPTPLYQVETDLVGEYIPAARELAHGVFNWSRFTFKGPGYSLMLLLVAKGLHGDYGLAARLLSVTATGVAIFLAHRIVQRTVGDVVATFVVLGAMVAPQQVQYAIEAGTDAPALAVMLASTWLVLRHRNAAELAVAGFLASFAILTRTNAIFLFPAAALVLALNRAPVRAIGAYAVGAIIPLASWWVFASRAGGPPADRNYLNIAWELYGHGVPWDRFQVSVGYRFHSILDVLRYDPLRACSRIATNLIAYRWLDLNQLVPPWIGLFAAPGIVLLARSGSARAWMAHGLFCALVLAPVFYSARFALYLLPCYLAAAGATFERLGTVAPALHSARKAWRLSVTLAALAVWIACAATTVAQTTSHLLDAPHEVRLAGESLAKQGLSGQAIAAQKPHVAYFANMQYVPMPLDVPLRLLAPTLAAAGTHYLFYSGHELVMHPDLAILADSDLALPGLQQVMWAQLPRDHFYAVYRLSNAAADSTAFERSFRIALARHEQSHGGALESELFVAVQLLATGSPEEALKRLDAIERAGVRTVAIEQFRSTALLSLGRLEEAASACGEAMRLGPITGWQWARLAEIRAKQGGYAEAQVAIRKALVLEPANLGYLKFLGRVDAILGNFADAAGAFERGLRLAPDDLETRRLAIGAYQRAGDYSRANRIYTDGLKRGLSEESLNGVR
jgi:4-amino-4-deoxy-L-arabinose transferase-like glycosyltransferase